MRSPHATSLAASTRDRAAQYAAMHPAVGVSRLTPHAPIEDVLPLSPVLQEALLKLCFTNLTAASMVSNSTASNRIRDPYTLRACNECQRRKRKCSGEQVCRGCRHLGTPCVFSESRASRPQRAAGTEARNSASAVRATDGDLEYAPAPQQVPRIVHSEPTQTSARNRSTHGRDHGRQPAQTRPPAPAHMPSPPLLPNTPDSTGNGSESLFSSLEPDLSSPHESVFERNTHYMTETAFLKQISMLELSVMRVKGRRPVTTGDMGSPHPARSPSATDARSDVNQVLEQVRNEDPMKLQRSLDLYFANVQPHYPSMNEQHVRAQLSAFVAKDTKFQSENASIQLATLVQFIKAVISILSDVAVEDDSLPGWEDFCLGEQLLTHATWLRKTNIVTIQTLLVKTLYLMYAGLLDAAYDAMGTTVRLCFQSGLHNEPSWGNDCNFYERTYRQRVLWSIFCLNHSVAHIRGVPELLREADVNVGLPKRVDDRMLYSGCPPLPEIPAVSPVSCLLETIRLTRLSSEVWEAMFGAQAKRPASQDFIISMDRKLTALTQDVPPFLRWPPCPESSETFDGVPSFIQQQAHIHHLRILHLRLLLRREEMISLTYGRDTAQLCIEIATQVVSAVETAYTAQRSNHCRRYAYLHHLTSALVPMICIIVRQNNGENLVRPALSLLNRSLEIIESLAKGSYLARRILRQLQRPLEHARESMHVQGLRDAHQNSQTAAIMPSMAPTQLVSWTDGIVDLGDVSDLAPPAVYDIASQEPTQQKIPDTSSIWDYDLWNDFMTQPP